MRPASKIPLLHTVIIKIITLQILIIKIWMRHHFSAKWTLYHNKIILSLLSQIIMVILSAERHPKNTKKKTRTILLPNNYWTDTFPTSCETNVAIRQVSWADYHRVNTIYILYMFPQSQNSLGAGNIHLPFNSTMLHCHSKLHKVSVYTPCTFVTHPCHVTWLGAWSRWRQEDRNTAGFKQQSSKV